jgi:hypothetical protein
VSDEPTYTCVTFWVEGDVPSDHDWTQGVPKGCAIDSARVKQFPWSDVYHEVQWWITRPMTFDEWVDLDDRESAVLASILGDDFMGTAGPIPFPPKDEE